MATSRLFELRTYHPAPGRADELHERFREPTLRLFEKHGLNLVGFWSGVDDEGAADDTLVYLLSFEDRAAADAAWAAFRVDPEWRAAYDKSNEPGMLVASAECVYLSPTDYSPMS